jgi:8-oxo-dGTP pyrophosphatase MutT (NUDIX family)
MEGQLHLKLQQLLHQPIIHEDSSRKGITALYDSLQTMCQVTNPRPEVPNSGSVRTCCTAIIISSDLKVLFIKRAMHDNDRWSGNIGFPGGKAEPGETRVQTLIRELHEEIGLKLQLVQQDNGVYDPVQFATPDGRKLACIGCLPKSDIYLSFVQRKVLRLYTYVLFESEPIGISKLIGTSPEVDKLAWTPLSRFTGNPNFVMYHVSQLFDEAVIKAASAIQKVAFQGIYVPVIELEAGPLWGLTLRQTGYFLRDLGYCRLHWILNSPVNSVGIRIFQVSKWSSEWVNHLSSKQKSKL